MLLDDLNNGCEEKCVTLSFTYIRSRTLTSCNLFLLALGGDVGGAETRKNVDSFKISIIFQHQKIIG